MSMATADEIISRLPTAFEKARESGDLLYFDSTLQKFNEGPIEYEVRVCPALKHKPVLPTFEEKKEAKEEGEKKDPFAPPYIPDLHVGDITSEEGDDYVILLNKFSIIPQHFLMVTKEFQSQSAPLYPSDLVQAYLLLSAARKAGKHFLAFFNCGTNSGASQLHKHLQFIPIEGDGPPIERLARSARLESSSRPFALSQVAYANHVIRFPSYFDPSTAENAQILHQAYLSLLDLTISTIRHDPNYPAGKPSYNLILSLEHMHLVPRSKENYILYIEPAKEGQEAGDAKEDKISVNALGFAGLLLVKGEGQLEAVKGVGVGKILSDVGVESVHEIQVASCG
jgi:ATP adenylyltransferase